MAIGLVSVAVIAGLPMAAPPQASLTTWAAGALFLIGVVATPAMVILAQPADL